jgi:hypothetical protein
MMRYVAAQEQGRCKQRMQPSNVSVIAGSSQGVASRVAMRVWGNSAVHGTFNSLLHIHCTSSNDGLPCQLYPTCEPVAHVGDMAGTYPQDRARHKHNIYSHNLLSTDEVCHT